MLLGPGRTGSGSAQLTTRSPRIDARAALRFSSLIRLSAPRSSSAPQRPQLRTSSAIRSTSAFVSVAGMRVSLRCCCGGVYPSACRRAVDGFPSARRGLASPNVLAARDLRVVRRPALPAAVDGLHVRHDGVHDVVHPHPRRGLRHHGHQHVGGDRADGVRHRDAAGGAVRGRDRRSIAQEAAGAGRASAARRDDPRDRHSHHQRGDLHPLAGLRHADDGAGLGVHGPRAAGLGGRADAGPPAAQLRGAAAGRPDDLPGAGAAVRRAAGRLRGRRGRHLPLHGLAVRDRPAAHLHAAQHHAGAQGGAAIDRGGPRRGLPLRLGRRAPAPALGFVRRHHHLRLLLPDAAARPAGPGVRPRPHRRSAPPSSPSPSPAC